MTFNKQKQDIKDQKNLIIDLINFYEKKGLEKESIKNLLEEAFAKGFERDKNYHDDNLLIAPANVTVKIDLDSIEIDVKITLLVVDELLEENRFINILATDPEIADLNLKAGDTYVRQILTKDIPFGKLQYIKQLFVQKIKEFEKKIAFEKFEKQKGKIIQAKITKVEQKYALLEKDGVIAFFPRSEMLSTDNLVVGKNIKVLVVEVQKNSKNSQIIVSRKNPDFVIKLIELNTDDVMDGIIKITNISREPGFKTKIAVISELSEVDSVGSIIGYKGQKIRSVIEELNGERIDVIQFSNNLTEFIANSVIPGRICGIEFKDFGEQENNRKSATIIVNDSEFLATIGKKGINIKLASILTNTKLDIITKTQANQEKISYTPYHYPNKNKNSFNEKRIESINLDEFNFNIETIMNLSDNENKKFEIE